MQLASKRQAAGQLNGRKSLNGISLGRKIKEMSIQLSVFDERFTQAPFEPQHRKAIVRLCLILITVYTRAYMNIKMTKSQILARTQRKRLITRKAQL